MRPISLARCILLAVVSAGVVIGPLDDARGQASPRKNDSAKKSDVFGPVVYANDGVELAGRKFAWKDLRSLEDLPPTREALEAERAERMKKFEALLALDQQNVDARRELGWVMVAKDWKRTADVAAERRKQLASDPKFAKPDAVDARVENGGVSSPLNAAKLEIAKFCADHGDPDDEWKLLVEIACSDPYDRAMIARLKPIVERRPSQTVLTPPLSGTWRAEVDATHHHQIKSFAFEAIDFRCVDAGGSTFRDKGTKLEDYYGFDQIVRAVSDGVVTEVDDSFPDLPPGIAGKYEEANHVSIDHVEPESSDYGHLRQHSVLVKAGDHVKAGQPIARVGNSGASGIPHLHFTLDMAIADEAGNGEWIGLPWRLHGFRVVKANGTACDFDAKCARVIEGWTMVFAEPK